MNRTKTGIAGFDELIGGGLIEGSTVLVSGGAGTGKTIFGLQFLYNGASKFNEPGIYVTLETRPQNLRLEAKQFGWDLEALEKNNTLIIIDAASNRAGLPTSERYALRRGFDVSTLAEEIHKAVEELGAKRLVIDCISSLGIRFNDPVEVRSELFRISALLNELKLTSLLVSEVIAPETQSRAGVEEFITQGLISLSLVQEKDLLTREMFIWKMRQTSHSMNRHQFVIGTRGIEIITKKKAATKTR